MFNRVFLYISKNLKKMLSTFLMFVVMISLVGTLAYVYATVGTRVEDVSVVRHNYVVDYDMMYGMGGEETVEEYKSVDDLFEKLLTLDGLEAYKIDMSMFGSYTLVEEEVDFSEDSEVYVSFQVAHDQKQMDFVSGKNEMVSGDFVSGQVVISEELAEKKELAIGDVLEISSFGLMEYGDEFDFFESAEISFYYQHNLTISGIYKEVEASEDEWIGMFNDIYVDLDTYNETTEAISAKEEELYGEDEFYYGGYGDVEFERVLAQYDNEESAKTLDKYVEEEYDFLTMIDSGKKMEESKEPLNDFNAILLIILIATLIISAIGIYLNMYLKLDKRRSEFISLLAFGINSFKLSIQVFFEQFIFLLLSVPFAYFLVNIISKTVIEIVKMYYIVVIERNMYESDEYFGSWLDYIYLNSRDAVEFAGVNLAYVILSVFAVMVVSLLILSIAEVSRRYKNVKKV